MQGVAIQKYVRMSPRKVRLIADMVRKITPYEAVTVLPYVRKRATDPVRKTIKAAISNAVVQGANPEELTFKEIQVTAGPKLKRFRPVSRGRAHEYARRMSHIRVVVEAVPQVAEEVEVKKTQPKKKAAPKKK